MLNEVKTKLIHSVADAIRPAARTSFWLLRMIVPITLFVVILDYIGVIAVIGEYISPLFELMGLDTKGALAFISSVFSGVYGAVGVMAGLGVDFRSATILATMCLICHNLIVETAIQKRTGSPAVAIALLRIGSALFAGFVINKILPASYGGTLMFNTPPVPPSTWGELFLGWLRTTGTLCLQVLVIVTLLTILQNIFKAFKIIDMLTKPLSWFMMIMGLPKSVSFLWVVANTLGLAYGGAVMIEESEKGELSKPDLRLFNTSIAQTHSILEDTFLLATIGINVAWLLIPRFIMSIITVWGQRFYRFLVKKKRRNLTIVNQ